MPRLLSLVLALSLLAPAARAETGLDPSFAKWLEGKRSPGYGEIAQRFLEAAGRDGQSYSEGMDGIERAFRSHVEAQKVGADEKARVDALRDFFFVKEQFEADLDLGRLENLYPDAILARRKGYCLGLTLVLLDLGERLGWPLEAGSAPRHTFVRYRSTEAKSKKPRALNIETTRRGELHDDAWYGRHFGLQVSPRALTSAETAAHLINNHGFVMLQLGHVDEAEKEFEAALRISPQLVEAWINLGVLEARRGRYSPALEKFDQALRRWPRDPELRMNRAQALLSLRRWSEATAALEQLIPDFADLPRLRRAVDSARTHLDPKKDWPRIQAMSIALNQRWQASSGKSRGLRGTYYRDAGLRDEGFQRVDADISFQWKWGSPGRSLPRDHFSVRWEGWLSIAQPDTYDFWVVLSDGVRLWIDGRRVIDSWRRANDNSAEVRVKLVPGLHDIRIDYFESVGEAGIKIFFTADSKDEILDLSKHLFHPRTNP